MLRTLNLREAAFHLFLGSRALVWAHEKGIINQTEYETAEEQFDITQNRLYNILHLDLDEQVTQDAIGAEGQDAEYGECLDDPYPGEQFIVPDTLDSD